MPEFVRVRDVATGHEYSEIASIVAANPGAYEVLEGDDVVATTTTGDRAPAVYNLPDAEAAYDGKTVADLKADLEGRGLPTDGLKTDLVARLADDDTKENS